jgi:hypothetical protein
LPVIFVLDLLLKLLHTTGALSLLHAHLAVHVALLPRETMLLVQLHDQPVADSRSLGIVNVSIENDRLPSWSIRTQFVGLMQN